MWKRSAHRVTLDTPDLSAQLDVAQPRDGIGDITVHWNGHSASLTGARLLRVQSAPESPLESISDCWVRGDDAVAVYAQTAQLQFCPEIYWRVLRRPPAVAGGSEVAGGWELIVSVHTNRLDAATRLDAASNLAADEILWLAEGAAAETARQLLPGDETFPGTGARVPGFFVFRSPATPYSYAEMIHPSDYCSAKFSWRGRAAELRWELFPESLEKGVIRRARLRGIFVPRDADVADAVRAYREFTASPPPLTT